MKGMICLVMLLLMAAGVSAIDYSTDPMELLQSDISENEGAWTQDNLGGTSKRAVSYMLTGDSNWYLYGYTFMPFMESVCAARDEVVLKEVYKNRAMLYMLFNNVAYDEALIELTAERLMRQR